MQHFILATAGHVDHGKSALVKALTGTDPDRLPEEKARGITIELGFAHLDLPASKPRFGIGIIDVPGHEDFVKNMVAGVGSIDLALLVVAADDGWMPQTEEHLQILTYLGVERAVVALAKADLGNAGAAADAVRERLRGTPYAASAIVRTSTMTGEGIDALRAELAAEFKSMKPQPDNGKPRLPVDRAFALRGIGTIVTGTLTGGTLKRGAAVVVQPGNISARVRMIQSHNAELEEALSGMRTALSIPDVPIARRRGERGVWRGDVITLPELGEPCAIADVLLARSPRLPARTPPIKHGAVVRVHHGSGSSTARVFFQSEHALPPGAAQVAQLRFNAPVFMFAGDRFVLRDSSEQHTIAGGVVLDPDADARRFRSEPQRELLKARAQSPRDAGTFVSTQLARDRVAVRAALLVKSCFPAAEIAAALDGLIARGSAVALGAIVADSQWWSALRAGAVAAIDAGHRDHPNVAGLDLGTLRGQLESAFPIPETFDALLGDLCGSGFERAGGAIKRGTHRPALPPQLQAAGAKLRAALSARPFDPPSRRELLPDSPAHQALRFLRDTGEIVEIGGDVVLTTGAFAQMKVKVADFVRQNGPSSASELRQMLGTSRRIVIPFLEQCDRDGLTQRAGDRRILAG